MLIVGSRQILDFGSLTNFGQDESELSQEKDKPNRQPCDSQPGFIYNMERCKE